ncbi:MAG: winged helix-turn-helix domain-containing protein [Phycisphaerales bacterium]|nr:winged helix-turn-helix domain-containing protein [Phycisphaerales bacterium]
MSSSAPRCRPARDAVRSGSARRRADDVRLADLARAIAHPARIRLLRTLADRQSCICGDLAGRLPLAQSTVSEHLRLLKESGLIRARAVGRRTCYCLEPRTLARLKSLMADL